MVSGTKGRRFESHRVHQCCYDGLMELWQLFDEQGRALVGKGASKDEIRTGLLHGASHIWIWRRSSSGIEILLQKRVDDKPTWPGLYDISAAGHVDLGEDPLESALRETSEEIGLDAKPEDLHFIGVYRCVMTTDSGIIENELQWLYLLELREEIEFNMQTSEVSSLDWKNINVLKSEWFDHNANSIYVPHGEIYYQMILDAIELAAKP